MKAIYELQIKYKIVQEIDNVKEVIDPHVLAEEVCMDLCDKLSDFEAVCSFDIIEGKIDIR